MRRFLAVLAAASLAVVTPGSAQADPAVTTVEVSGYTDDVSLTCDTSSYPAPYYPCDFSVDVTTGCDELTHVENCRLGLRGVLRATPHPSRGGRCQIAAFEDTLVTFQSGADPSFHVEQYEVTVAAPEVGAYVLAGGVDSGIVITVVAPYRLGEILPEPLVGTVVTRVGFTDLMYDCRNRFGGDPSIDPSAGGGGPRGTLAFVRPE